MSVGSGAGDAVWRWRCYTGTAGTADHPRPFAGWESDEPH